MAEIVGHWWKNNGASVFVGDMKMCRKLAYPLILMALAVVVVVDIATHQVHAFINFKSFGNDFRPDLQTYCPQVRVNTNDTFSFSLTTSDFDGITRVIVEWKMRMNRKHLSHVFSHNSTDTSISSQF